MRNLFDLTAPLPRGTTVLEASAGTGKTFAIAALAARYIAEGVAGVDDLLLITFSRAATAELRSRVRERLRDTAVALEAAARGAQPEEQVAALLADAEPAEVAARAARLADAFARFDKAAIMTTHEFCHGMLAGLGILAPQTPQSTLVEDLRPLADEAAEDTYVRMFADAPDGAPFPFGKVWDADPGARDIARDAVSEVAELVGAGTPGAAGLGWSSPRPSAPRWPAASASAGCTRSTTSSPGSPTPSTTRSAASRRAPAWPGGSPSCSWTSSRTPTPRSGGCCAARSVAGRRWC